MIGELWRTLEVAIQKRQTNVRLEGVLACEQVGVLLEAVQRGHRWPQHLDVDQLVHGVPLYRNRLMGQVSPASLIPLPDYPTRLVFHHGG